MLGHKLCQVLAGEHKVFAAVRSGGAELGEFGKVAGHLTLPAEQILTGLDAESDDSLAAIFAAARPTVVINCVGIVKQLDLASERFPSIAINSLLPHRLHRLCQKTGARLIHISTDCVFSGSKGPYVESDFADAYDVYGRSKWLGEVIDGNALTIRTSIIGRQLSGHHSLLDWFLLNKNSSVSGYSKAIFSGLTTLELSRVIGEIIRSHQCLSGLYQVASEPIDKFSLLSLIKNVYDLNIVIDENDQFKIDRSLCDDKFRTITGFAKKSWQAMIEEMYEFDRGRYS